MHVSHSRSPRKATTITNTLLKVWCALNSCLETWSKVPTHSTHTSRRLKGMHQLAWANSCQLGRSHRRDTKSPTHAPLARSVRRQQCHPHHRQLLLPPVL
jgi:hypothetical protein